MFNTRNREYREWQRRMEQRRQKRLRGTTDDESVAIREQRKARAIADYRYFVETYFPDVARCECANFQIDAAQYILSHNRARAVFEWARGHAKSTHMGVFVPLWLKIQKVRQYNTMVLVSKSEDSACRLLADLQQELAYNDLFIHDFGEQIKFGSWADGEFVTTDNFSYHALGRGQSPRGLKNKGARPDYILIDDIDDDEMCRNPKRVNETTQWCLSALLGTMEAGRGRFIMVGNRISKNSVLALMCDRPNIYHTVVNILQPDGTPTWHQNYSIEEINELRTMSGERMFQKEYMNNPTTDGAIFMQKDIRFGSMLPLRQYKEIVCYTDPSFRSSSTADYKATMLVGVTADGAYHVLKAYCEQTTVTRLIEWHYEIMDYVQGVSVRYYMEANFIQDLLMKEFDEVGAQVGLRIPLMPDKRAKGDKFARIENMQPLFARGMVLMNDKERDSVGMQNLIEQLLLFEKGSRIHDDAPDALESAIWMLQRNQQKRTAPYRVIRRTNRSF